MAVMRKFTITTIHTAVLIVTSPSTICHPYYIFISTSSLFLFILFLFLCFPAASCWLTQPAAPEPQPANRMSGVTVHLSARDTSKGDMTVVCDCREDGRKGDDGNWKQRDGLKSLRSVRLSPSCSLLKGRDRAAWKDTYIQYVLEKNE